MGNLFSHPAEMPSEVTSEWIEKLYEARAAAERAAIASENGMRTDEDISEGGRNKLHSSVTDEREDQSNKARNSNDQHQAIFSADEFSSIGGINNIPIPINALDAATVHLTIAIRSASIKADDALKIAIDTLKNMDLVVVVKAVTQWIKAHPWETAAIVVPLILLACTPAFLGLAGFTAGGITAGSIAAGIQAGIGSVAASSVFATLTSAAMGGYGVLVVFGGVWIVSSAVMGGIAAWMKRRKADANTIDWGDGGKSTKNGNGDGGDGSSGDQDVSKAVVRT
ncbi:hypothetical protein DE146DRAFT_677319 [Phaeosphaeria sp. MPI-PUGE-AT-0046c]|nr:hypothetical protein DE146DRAFT_677319 [Phaeosphaeria sp. MPI-PUGE-AT-0046c]